MKLSRSWLQHYVDLSGLSDDDISRAITFLGFEVEQIIRTGAPSLSNVVAGRILTREKHPNADKLSVCTVDVGPAHGGVRTIVCGAPNCDAGRDVPVALPGAVLPGNFVIKESKVRGQLSAGMMCSAKELTIADDAQGLLLLEDNPAPGTAINDVLPPGDVVFDIEITPNRPDALSHLGAARELAAWFRRELRYPAAPVALDALPTDAARPDLLTGVEVASPEDCPLYTATVLTGVKVGSSPEWLRRLLTAVGLRPVNNIVDITNYVLLEYGQPLHAFDAARLRGASLQIRRAAAGEKITTLDGKERALDPDLLVIADATGPQVVAGVMGGRDSGVSDSTTDLVLEGAIFRRQTVRTAVKRLGLSSDSSYRYERGVDPHFLPEAVRRALGLLCEIAGGRIAGSTFAVGGDVPWQREIELYPAYVNARLGFTIPVEDQRAALERLELRVTGERTDVAGQSLWTVSIPSWRDDLERPIDLVEEILRLHGTENIPAAPVLAVGLVGDDDPVALYNTRAIDYLAGHDFHECVNYTLRPASELAAGRSADEVAALSLANPFVEDQSHLRASLLGGLLESLRLNQSRGVSATRLAETGRVFLRKDGKLWECAAVAFLIAEPVGERAWHPRSEADFYTVKHHLSQLCAFAGLDLARQPVLAPAPGFQVGQAAAVGAFAHGYAAEFGLLDLGALKALGIEGKVYAGHFAILPEKIAQAAGGARRRYAPFGLLPAALRDVAVVVPDTTPAAEVQKALAKHARAAAGPAFALEAVEIFDVYTGKGIPEGHKSLAFSLSFRAPDRTLTDDEVNTAFGRIQADLSAAGYAIRK